MTNRRVVVTGMGIVSPVGSNVEEAWNNVREGNSGIGPIEDFDATGFSTRIGGIVIGFDIAAYTPSCSATMPLTCSSILLMVIASP